MLLKLVVKYNVNSVCKTVCRCINTSLLSCFSTNKSETFQNKLMTFLRTDKKYKVNTLPLDVDMKVMVPPPIVRICGDAISSNSLECISNHELPYFVYYIGNSKASLPSSCYEKLVQGADDECCKKFHTMNKQDVLKTLDAWFYTSSSLITKLKFYSLFMPKTQNWLVLSSGRIEEMLQPLFFISMQKKSHKSQNIIQKYLTTIDKYFKSDVTLPELCIISYTAYKTSTKIHSVKLLKHICHILDKNLRSLLAEEVVFISFIKCLRHARFYDFKLMSNISSLPPHLLNSLTFTSMVHLMAWYADALYRKDDFMTLLVDASTTYLTNSVRFEDGVSSVRIKDIARFLWATSYLSCILPSECIKSVGEIIHQKLILNEHVKYPEHIIGSLLFLWMMGHRDASLFKTAITGEVMEIIKGKGLFRHGWRLSLLLTIIKIEMPEILNEEHKHWSVQNKIPPEALNKQRKKRTVLNDIYATIKKMSYDTNFNATCDYAIPNLNILGIAIQIPNREPLHVEVLDNSVCLKNSHTPHGLMKLKLRLLESLGHNVIVINDNKTWQDINLIMYLENKLLEHSRAE